MVFCNSPDYFSSDEPNGTAGGVWLSFICSIQFSLDWVPEHVQSGAGRGWTHMVPLFPNYRPQPLQFQQRMPCSRTILQCSPQMQCRQCPCSHTILQCSPQVTPTSSSSAPSSSLYKAATSSSCSSGPGASKTDMTCNSSSNATVS